ncbi:hypothetical protein KSP39_PZI013462 [Platanthera zijinensis]|uniref:Uncharacterized protein n=1 Tax=Platanthera zijinensis TaxID=2320716 RepID=A0AAP0G389_9ASPA
MAAMLAARHAGWLPCLLPVMLDGCPPCLLPAMLDVCHAPCLPCSLPVMLDGCHGMAAMATLVAGTCPLVIFGCSSVLASYEGYSCMLTLARPYLSNEKNPVMMILTKMYTASEDEGTETHESDADDEIIESDIRAGRGETGGEIFEPDNYFDLLPVLQSLAYF